MENYSPTIEILPPSPNTPPRSVRQPWYQTHRAIVFSIIFTGMVIVSLTYNFQRPAVYRSAATLLTSAMTAVDQDSTRAADSQHVALQRELLLSPELMAATLAKLNDNPNLRDLQLGVADLQNLLQVEAVPNTNLVEIHAQGHNKQALPIIINTWIDTYLGARQREVKKLTDDTTHLIEDELKGLQRKVNAKRSELETFRLNNNILSSGRDENEVLARLKGLTDSLNQAHEEEVKAKTSLNALKAAIAAGEPIVPEPDQSILQNLEKRRQELKEKNAQLHKQFTQDYINLQPAMKSIPEEIEKIESEILKKLDYGKNNLLATAEKEYNAARQSVKAIQAQLEQHKKQAALFTTQFTRHETLKTDLDGLEKLYRDAQERLVQIQTLHKDQRPQVNVINRAYEAVKPIGPNYQRDSLIAIAGSLGLSLFLIWMLDFLSRLQQPPAGVTLSGIHMYQPTADLLRYPEEPPTKPLSYQDNNRLTAPAVRELSDYELKVLQENANFKAKQLIALLLSGLTPVEIINLSPEQIDLTEHKIIISGSSPRVLPLYATVKSLWDDQGYPAWGSQSPGTLEQLNTSLLCAAIDSGLPQPDQISADAIRHSYITYLVRQGLRLSDLEGIVGHLEPPVMLGYTSYSPPQKGLGINEINLLHPALNYLHS